MPAPGPGASQAPVATPAIPPDRPGLGVEALRRRAEQAMREQHLFAPAHDNALEYYLALRAQQADDAGTLAALEDLAPQLVISAEQALANGRQDDATRLVDLLQQVDADAPALGRLRGSLAEAARLALAREQAADAAARAAAEQAEADLRRQSEANAARLAAERATLPPATPKPPATSSVPATGATTTPAVAAADTATVPPVRQEPARSRPAASETPPAAKPLAPVASAPPRPTGNIAPRLVRDMAPNYPESGLRRRLSGVVQLSFVINADGDVESPQVVSSTLPTAFERAAVAAASRWKFEASGHRQKGSRSVAFAPPGG